MARKPNEKVEQAKAMFDEGKALVDIAAELGLPPGTVRRWKSTYGWGKNGKKKQNERSDSDNERSDIESVRGKGGQPGNINALKNAKYANEYWKHISDEEREMMNEMPIDVEYQLVESLRLAVVREKRCMALLSRYRELLKRSENGMVPREEIQTLAEETVGKKYKTATTQSVQRTMVDATEQIEIIEGELTRIQRVKIKILDSLAKVRNDRVAELLTGSTSDGFGVNNAETVNIYLPDNGRN